MTKKVRMSPVKKETFEKALEKHGYKKDRSKGGHETWKKTVTKTCTIPCHGNEISAPLAKKLSKEHDLDLF